MVVFLIAFSKVLKMAMYHPDFFTLFNHRYVNHLVEKDYCHGVHEEYEEQPVNLKTCARCQLAQYCSVACQKYDFEDHKNFCKRIKTLTDKVEALGRPLHNIQIFNWPFENIFETKVGNFWSLLKPRDYCRTRLQLADVIYYFGYLSDSKRIYEVALSHYLELLRLIHGDNMGIRNKVPFVLLNLNRDQDAYDFIKWWETIDPNGRYDWGEPPPSREGDWLYLRDQDLLEDLLKIVKSSKNFPLQFLAALVLIKGRIIFKQQVHQRKFQIFTDFIKTGDATCRKLFQNNLILKKIENMVLPYSKSEIQAQEVLLKKYLHIIQNNNPFFLKAVVNPGLVMNMAAPEYVETGTVSEVYFCLDECKRLFARNEVAMEHIQALVGKNPKFQELQDDQEKFAVLPKHKYLQF